MSIFSSDGLVKFKDSTTDFRIENLPKKKPITEIDSGCLQLGC